jgi:hypothetical protein
MKILFLFIITLSILSCTDNSVKKNETTEPDFKNEVVVKKKFLKRQSYKMEYPFSWKIDSSDHDYDIDNYFTLDSPSDGCFATFMFFNTNIDEKEHLDEQVKEHLKGTIKNGIVSYFDKWGEYKGHGAIIKGKLLGVFKGELKLFVHSSDSSSFLIFSQLNDEDKLKDEDGLKLIEASFRLK